MRVRAGRGLGGVALCGAAFCAWWAYRAGQDANWDLQNYHDYAAYAFLHWRYPLDVGMGGFQGYFNPLPYVVPYALRHSLPPLAAGLALAVLQSGTAIVAWVLSGALLPAGARHPVVLRALATAAGCTGATVLSEIGTSFADLFLAPLVLGGLALLLQAGTAGDGARRNTARTPILAGVLVGAATGLKLTNAVFAAGLACAAAVPWRPLPVAARTAGLVGLGIAAGFLLTGGAWAAYLWASLGNPVFPALNTIFRSPSAAFSDYADPRFLPAGFWDGLAYPAKIAFGLHPTAEVPFREPRFLVVLGVLAALAISACLPRGRGGAILAGPRHRLLQASVFLMASMAAWLKVFAIQRYAVSLELLSGVVAVMALSHVMRGGPALAAAVALAGGIVGATQPPDWWRRPWSDAVTIAPPPELSVPAAYAVVAYPVGYWASALPGKSRFYTVDASLGLATGGVLQDRVRRGLQYPPNGLVRTLGHDFPMSEAARDGLAAQGLVPAGPCVRTRSLWWVDTISCVAARAGTRPRAAANLVVGEAVDFSAKGSGWIYLAGAWRSTVAAGTEAQTGRSELVLHVENTDHPLVLDLTLQGAAPDQPGRRVAILRDGVEQASHPLPLPGQPETATICLAPASAAPATRSVVLDTEGRADLPSFVLQRMLLREAGQGECRP